MLDILKAYTPVYGDYIITKKVAQHMRDSQSRLEQRIWLATGVTAVLTKLSVYSALYQSLNF